MVLPVALFGGGGLLFRLTCIVTLLCFLGSVHLFLDTWGEGLSNRVCFGHQFAFRHAGKGDGAASFAQKFPHRGFLGLHWAMLLASMAVLLRRPRGSVRGDAGVLCWRPTWRDAGDGWAAGPVLERRLRAAVGHACECPLGFRAELTMVAAALCLVVSVIVLYELLQPKSV